MRNRDTSAATAARVRAKHERWLRQMIDAGYLYRAANGHLVVVENVKS